ncbi:MAG: cupredoxin family copper-binding protein [Hyphomicrobiales bacterium]
MGLKLKRRQVLVGAAAYAGALAIFQKPSLAEAPQVHEVRIKAFQFEPMHISVKQGDTIKWTNEDLAPHTATANEGGWDTGEIVKGDSRSIVATKGMEVDYFCAFHPHMKGTIEVA